MGRYTVINRLIEPRGNLGKRPWPLVAASGRHLQGPPCHTFIIYLDYLLILIRITLQFNHQARMLTYWDLQSLCNDFRRSQRRRGRAPHHPAFGDLRHASEKAHYDDWEHKCAGILLKEGGPILWNQLKITSDKKFINSCSHKVHRIARSGALRSTNQIAIGMLISHWGPGLHPFSTPLGAISVAQLRR